MQDFSKLLPQGTAVRFKIEQVEHTGVIRGVAMMPTFGIGATYIIEIAPDALPGYPYSGIALPASILTVE